MTITSSGAVCDVCGNLILPIDPEELVHEFSVKGISQNLHCDTRCKELLIKIGKNWEQLPHEGALYKAFEDAQGEYRSGKMGQLNWQRTARLKTDEEVKKIREQNIAREYWVRKRGFSEYEYAEVIKNCEADNFGFCESCMGAMFCELHFTH